MRFKELLKHLESAPLVAGAARRCWDGAAQVVYVPVNGMRELYLMPAGTDEHYRYAFNIEDALADDWEPT